METGERCCSAAGGHNCVILDANKQRTNICTVAWTGTVCSDPPMLSISLRKERHSHSLISETREFVVNVPGVEQVRATDYCGVVSGRDVDKFKETGLTPAPASKVKAALILECPLNLECRVKKVLELGSHTMFVANVLAVQVNELAHEIGNWHWSRQDWQPLSTAVIILLARNWDSSAIRFRRRKHDSAMSQRRGLSADYADSRRFRVNLIFWPRHKQLACRRGGYRVCRLQWSDAPSVCRCRRLSRIGLPDQKRLAMLSQD